MHDDDRLLDRLGAGRGALFTVDGHHGADQTTRLLAAWRREMQPAALPRPIAVGVADRALRRASGRGSLRPMLAVVAAITLLLMAAATIGARTARPGDTLWPLTQVMWHDRADSVLAGEAARQSLNRARAALADGDAGQAIVALTAAAANMGKVQDLDGRTELKAVYNELMNRASSRLAPTPSATVAVPVGPGYTSPPAAGSGGGGGGSTLFPAGPPSTSEIATTAPSTTPAPSSTSAPSTTRAPSTTSASSTHHPSTTPAPSSTQPPPSSTGDGSSVSSTPATTPTSPTTAPETPTTPSTTDPGSSSSSSVSSTPPPDQTTTQESVQARGLIMPAGTVSDTTSTAPSTAAPTP